MRKLLSPGSAVAALSVLLLAAHTAHAQTPKAAEPNSCLSCHASQTDARLSTPATLFRGSDVHRDRGFACIDCHGGNPTTSDKTLAHDVSGKSSAMAFRGKPAGQALIAACARCHSDAELMRTFAPKQRVDQATEYATSVHGKRLAAGDANVATCATCHGAHGVRLVNDAKSPVYPTNVANLCASCHADQKHMAPYKAADGSPLPTTQLADYKKSVHFAAMTKGNDLSAPTCNDCHGNHGAAPPGVGSMANVCGTCHVVFAQKFETSVHKELFDKGCVECHGNHAVLKPTDEMLGSTGHAICVTCHNGKDDTGAAGAQKMRDGIEQLKAKIASTSTLIDRVKNAGIEVSDDELALHEASSKVTLARTEMHAFKPEQVTPIIADGLKIAEAVEKNGQNGVAELQYRRRGLGFSLGAILVVVVGLALKVKQIDKANPH
jgi:predicted CXXCH cytochrome family protein